MTLPTGQISLSQVNTELGYPASQQVALNDSAVRTLAGVPSGQISMSNLQGKSNQFAFTIASNQTNANLRSLAVTAGWNQSTKVVATINSGVYVSANSTAAVGLTIDGAWPGGVTLVNNGYIIGMGGAGGNANGAYGSPSPGGGTNGSAGGKALAVATPVTIANNGTIGGGGGGGGGGQDKSDTPYKMPTTGWGGGGGGGGQTGATNSAGGAGGSYYPAYSRPSYAGASGTSAGGGAGGLGAAAPNASYYAGSGATGGSWGAAGPTGNAGATIFNGPSFTNPAGTAGGAAGACLTGNGYISWSATGTRLGSIS